ncbi:hypothetical protein GCM10010124_05230 [Pilimelia terevasa]|uniref:N-acetyltransferase domain-containing protein n=1 Tax=Pilimelia terevasa TaxID=53372 RepID=A0A8J3BFD8_9ACTN|nr:GNAT family N-acetyltransferase [Pilimelia terevasa]GGK15454.1 hypothetical protein GCM10010124_05230 [Pilimelia terevasa]
MEYPSEALAYGVRLRRYREDDVPAIVAGCGDPLTQRFMPLMPRGYDEETARAWIRTGLRERAAHGGYSWAVADPATDRLLAGAGMRVSDNGRNIAEVGYWTVPDARGRGVATAATRALTDLAFAHGIARLELLNMWANVGSQRVALAAGYRREGERRGVLPGPDGTRHDVVAWARLATDDGAPTPRLLPDLPGGALEDGVVRLRPLAEGDAAVLHALRRVPDVVASGVPPEPPTAEDVTRRCVRAAGHWLAGTRADLVILDAASGEVAGDLGLYYQEPLTGQAMVGCSLFPRWRGRGYAGRATVLLARWAFDIGVRRLVAGAAPDNVGSQRTLERVGFRREGRSPDRLPGPGGGRTDDILYGLLPTYLT